MISEPDILFFGAAESLDLESLIDPDAMISMDDVIPTPDLEEESDVYLLVIGSFFDREEEWGEYIIADDEEDAITG